MGASSCAGILPPCQLYLEGQVPLGTSCKGDGGWTRRGLLSQPELPEHQTTMLASTCQPCQPLCSFPAPYNGVAAIVTVLMLAGHPFTYAHLLRRVIKIRFLRLCSMFPFLGTSWGAINISAGTICKGKGCAGLFSCSRVAILSGLCPQPGCTK